jgi:colicin import membrane protein
METPLKIFKDSVKAKMKEQAELIGGDYWITDYKEFIEKMKPEIERFKREDKDQSDRQVKEVFKENRKRYHPSISEEEQLLLLQEEERRKQAQVLLEIKSLREPEASRAATAAATATASGAANGSWLERGHEHHQGLVSARARFLNDFPGGNKKRRKTRKHRRKHKRKTKKHKRKRKTKKRKHRRKQKRKTHRR